MLSGHGNTYWNRLNTSTTGFAGAHIMGKYGVADASYSWYVANGTSPTATGLAAKLIGSTGNMFIDGTYGGPAAYYAEMFETFDSKTIDVGYFVTFAKCSDKIRKSTLTDDYILGVTSATPVIIGDNGELRWKNKYIVDDWGRVQYHKVTILMKRILMEI